MGMIVFLYLLKINQVRKIYLPLLLLFFSLGFSQSQTIFKDPTFQSPKLTYTNYQVADSPGGNDILIQSIKRQVDGKLLVAGLFTNYNGNPVLNMVRLNQDGSQDLTFQLSTEDLPATNIYKILIQTDNKIVILSALQYGNAAKLIRLLPNGTRDTTFNEANFTGFNLPLCEIQSDDKLIVAIPSYSQMNGLTNNGLLRLNSDGTLDTSFTAPLATCETWGNSDFKDLKIDSNGKIIIVGGELYFPSCAVKRIIRLNPNGSEDAAFIPPAEIVTGNCYPKKICLLNDGTIAIAGQFGAITGNNNITFILKLNTNGTQVTNYSYGTGFGVNDVNAMAVQADNKLVVYVRNDTFYDGVPVEIVFRFNIDGSPDTTFDMGPDTIRTPGHTYSEDLLIKPDGNIIIGGDYTVAGNLVSGLVEVNSSGSFNSNFNIGTGFRGNGYINKIQQLSDGKILIAGAFDSVNGITRRGIARLNADGSYDATFGGGVGFGINTIVETFTLQSDGKIIVGGNFSSYDGLLNIALIRLNADGTIDTTFTTSTELYNSYIQGFVSARTRSIVLQNDGKIIVGGAFVIYNGVTKKHIMRLNIDGTVDTTFLGSGFDSDILELVLQPDQKILVTGYFTKYNNVLLNTKLIRLNTNGTRDMSFVPTGYTYNASKLVALQDGKILSIKSVNLPLGNTFVLVKLNADGTTDSSFLANMGYLNIQDFCLQPDGKILVAASSYDNVLKRISRFHEDGSLDAGFDIGTGIEKKNFVDFGYGNYGIEDEPNANSLFLQNDGKILVGGYFSHLDGDTAIGTTRLLNMTTYQLKGISKLDQNNNGCDGADLVFPSLKFDVTGTNGTSDYIGNTTGNYNIGTIAGSYTVTPIFENPTYFTASPSSIIVDFPTQNSPQVQNFCITPNGVHNDLEITLVPLTVARPGFDAYYKLVFKNKGNQLQSGTINLTFNDAVLDLVSANPTTSSQSLNNLNWSFSNLNPFETRDILFTLNLNTPTETPPVNSGFILNYTTSVTTTLTDELPNDNIFSLNQTVLNSLDPNDKTCLEGTTIGLSKVGDYVHYIIRFENSGTYAAQNISVRDVIDISKYDINTLVPTSGSHLFVTKITDTNKVEFYFENINLSYLDATNDGYVAFKIKTKSTLVAGNSFSNSAAIFFDYNEAIITNTATTLVQPNLETVDSASENYIVLYPNPVNSILNISKNQNVEISSITIYNTLGQLIMAIPNARNTESIDVSVLKSGNYFVKVNSDSGILTSRFVKI
jgi:uncharacterized delta-60 repeat protein